MLDVYIGFMDEEVASVLDLLVDEAIARGRPLLVMERGRVDNLLFERHLSSYRHEFNKIVVDGAPISEDDWTQTFFHSIQMMFDTGLFSKYQQRSHNLVKQKVRLNRPGTEPDQSIFLCSVLGLNFDRTNSKDAIVVIRSPEMGFQPDLTRTYLRAAIRSLHEMPGFDRGVNVRVFGAGGATAAGDGPGSVHRITGSVFVGSAVMKDPPTENRYQGIVRFVGFHQASQGNDRQFTDIACYASAGTGDKAQAERQARSAFALLCGDRPAARDLLEGKETLAIIESGFDSDRARELKHMISESTDGRTSLTASFFIGKKIKALARGLDLHDANMEDYHILKILKSIQEKDHKYGGLRLEQVEMVRVDCDPPEIGEDTVAAFTEWLAGARYSRDKYLAAIKWGLYGLALPAAKRGRTPDTRRNIQREITGLVSRLQWDWPQERLRQKPEDKTLFYVYADSRLQVILDPFCVEMATDFLNDLNSGRAFALNGKKIPPAIIDGLQRSVRKLGRLHANSTGDRLAPYFCDLIEQLVDHFLQGLHTESDEYPFVDPQNPQKFKIWIRPGSWNQNKSVLSTDLEVDEATLDRAFYKSANQAALQTHAARIITEQP